MRWKSLPIGLREICMFVLVVAALLLRVMLIQNNWPTTNSDEATMGLMAMHIIDRGEHPIFFYGQAYMGSLEAYAATPLFRTLGSSLVTLRLALLPFFALFLVSMYFLTRLLYNKSLALATTGLLSLGSSEIILHQLRAIGGYPEIVLFAALIFLISCQLAFSSGTAKPGWRRRLVFGSWGLLAGLAIWDDQIVLPCIVAGGLLLLLYCRQELRGWPGLSLLMGLLIGALPLIYYNLTAPIEQNSLTVLFRQQIATGGQQTSLPGQIAGTLLIALPAITGMNPVCQTNQFPFFGPATPQTWQCSTLQGAWTLGYLLLWGSAAVLSASVLWRFWRKRSRDPRSTHSFEERQMSIRHSASLLLLGSAMLTLLLYMRSPAAFLYPGPTSRYLICMQIATPAVLWPLWHGFSSFKASSFSSFKGGSGRLGLLCRVALLLSIEVMFLLGTVRTIQQIPAAQADYHQKDRLVHDLLSIGATRVYSEYFNTCNRIIFQSDERIICSSLNENLQPAFDRYLPYRAIVRAMLHPTYVFPIGSAQQQAIERKLQSLHVTYQRYTFDGYIAYRTEHNIR